MVKIDIVLELEKLIIKYDNFNLENIEKIIITNLLRENSQEKVAEMVGLSDRGIRYKLKKWGQQ